MTPQSHKSAQVVVVKSLHIPLCSPTSTYIHKFHADIFLLGFIAAIKLHVAGEIYAGEILALLYLALRRPTISPRTFVGLAGLYALAQLFSDIINATAPISSLKGILAPILLITTCLAIKDAFASSQPKLPAFLAGAIFSKLIQAVAFPSEYYLLNPWKWGIGKSVLMLLAIYFSFYSRKKATPLYICIIAFSVFTFYNGGRSMGIISLIALLIYILPNTLKTWLSHTFGNKYGMVKLLLVCIPIVILLNTALSAALSSEALLSRLPSNYAAKYEKQASGKYGVLLGGRSEMLVSAKAFMEKPFLGHGSWAHDSSGYIAQLLALKAELGYISFNEVDRYTNEWLIPTHSYIMGALVWAGICGGIFWLYTISMATGILINRLTTLPFYFYIATLNFVWSALFSPFGADARWETALFLGALIVYTQSQVRKKVILCA